MDLIKYFTFSMIIFILGIWGILLNRRNILIMLMSIELKNIIITLFNKIKEVFYPGGSSYCDC